MNRCGGRQVTESPPAPSSQPFNIVRAIHQRKPRHFFCSDRPDYRPKYPKIDPEEVINPNHPNLTIWANEIEVALFIGGHCHDANLALRMVRAGTNCLTIAFSHDIHEDAMLSVQDFDVRQMDHIIEVFRTVCTDLEIAMPKDGKIVRLMGTQIRANYRNPQPA